MEQIHPSEIESQSEVAIATVRKMYVEVLKILPEEKMALINNAPTETPELAVFIKAAEAEGLNFKVINFFQPESLTEISDSSASQESVVSDSSGNPESDGLESVALKHFKQGHFNAAVRIGEPIPEIDDVIHYANNAQIRMLLMPGISLESLQNQEPFLSSFEEMRSRSQELLSTLKDATEITISDGMGRSLSIGLNPNEPWTIEAVDPSKPLTVEDPEPPNLPQGEMYKNPIRDKTSGILVIKPGGRIDSTIVSELLQSDVVLRFYHGRVVGIEGGTEAAILDQNLKETAQQENSLEALYIAEIAVGTNSVMQMPNPKQSDTVFDEKALTVHLAIGNSSKQPDLYNDAEPANTGRSDSHLDFVLDREQYRVEATLRDGSTVVIFGPAGRFDRY